MELYFFAVCTKYSTQLNVSFIIKYVKYVTFSSSSSSIAIGIIIVVKITV